MWIEKIVALSIYIQQVSRPFMFYTTRIYIYRLNSKLRSLLIWYSWTLLVCAKCSFGFCYVFKVFFFISENPIRLELTIARAVDSRTPCGNYSSTKKKKKKMMIMMSLYSVPGCLWPINFWSMLIIYESGVELHSWNHANWAYEQNLARLSSSSRFNVTPSMVTRYYEEICGPLGDYIFTIYAG